MFDFNGQMTQGDVESYQAPTPENNQDPVEKFLAHLAEFNLSPGVIVPDGKLHRFGKKKVCWYVFYSGDICGAAFGDWSTGLKETWCSEDVSKLTYHAKKEFDKLVDNSIKQAAKEQAKNQAKAQKAANEIWPISAPLEGDSHPYLKNKRTQAYGEIRTCTQKHPAFPAMQPGDLLIPLYDRNGLLWSLEAIKPNGKKRFQRHGKKQGNWFEIPGKSGNKSVYIVEGYSTGTTVHGLTGSTIIVAFDAGNVVSIARDIKELYPGYKIVIAADNDAWTLINGRPSNTGIIKAQEAANIIGAQMVYPKFKPESIEEWRKQTGKTDKGPTDFNDLAALEGGQAVRDQVAKPQQTEIEIRPFFSGSTGNLFAESKNGTDEQQFIFSRPGDKKPGGLRVGVIGYEGGEGGSGKTRIWFQIGASIAYGHDFTGGAFDFYETGPFYMVAGEDSRDIMAEISTMLVMRAKESGFEIPKELQSNFHFRCADGGTDSPCLFRRDRSRNLERTDAFYDLIEDCKRILPVVLVLDSQSIIIGMGEESNEDAGIISGQLKVLLKYCKAVVIIAHTNKNSTQAKATAADWNRAWPSALSVEALRGSSGLVFNGRYLKLTTKVPPRFNEELGAGEKDRLVACAIPKANGAMEIYEPFYFKQRLYSWTNNQGTKSYSVLWDYFEPDVSETERKAQEDAAAEAADQTRRANIFLYVIRKRVELALEQNNPPGKKGSPGNLNSIAQHISEDPLKFDLPSTMDRNKAIRELKRLFKDGVVFDKESFKIIFSKDGAAHFKVKKPSPNQAKLKGFEDKNQCP